MHHPEQAKLPLSLQVPVLVQRQIRVLVTAEGDPGAQQRQQQPADIIVPNPVEMPQGVAEPLLLCRLHGQHQTGHRRALGQRHGAFGDGRRPLDPAGQHMGAQSLDQDDEAIVRLRRHHRKIGRCAGRILLAGRMQRRKIGAP